MGHPLRFSPVSQGKVRSLHSYYFKCGSPDLLLRSCPSNDVNLAKRRAPALQSKTKQNLCVSALCRQSKTCPYHLQWSFGIISYPF